MIIDIVKRKRRSGYIDKEGTGIYYRFFATANAAFRREVFSEYGMFDEKCITGEDVDISLRLIKSNRSMWFAPDARVFHFHRATIGALIRQWFGYSMHHPYLYMKYNPRPEIAIYGYNPFRGKSITRYLQIPAPFYFVFFVGHLHVLTLTVLLTALAFALGYTLLTWIGLALVAVMMKVYFKRLFSIRYPIISVTICAIHLVSDFAYILGGFLGGLKQKMIFFDISRPGVGVAYHKKVL